MADLARLQKDKVAARELLEKAIALIHDGIRLVGENPANTESKDGLRGFQSDLARYTIVIAKEQIGDKSPAGIRAVNVLLTETEWLLAATSDPDSVETQLDLARLMALAGDNYLFAATDAPAAKNNYERSLRLLEKIRNTMDSREIQSDIAMGHYRLGTAQLRLKNYGDASAEYQASLVIREQHFKELPTERARLTLMVNLARAGQVERAAKMVEEFRPITQMKDEFPFDAACTYAICAWVMGNWHPDADLTADQLKLRKEYVQKALADVREVLKSGSSYVGQLATDPDLEFLQGLPDFQALLREKK
jgi:hypothetical protein